MNDTYTATPDADGDSPPEPLVLPLDAWHRARGARMVPGAGYDMPAQYEGIIAEHLWTRQHAGFFDVSHMGQLEVSGEGAIAALEALLPGDFAALKPGHMCYSLLLAEDGGILDDLTVTNRGGDFYLVVNGATKWDDIAHLRENLPDEITLNHLDEHGLFALQGPEAALVLASLGLEPAADTTAAPEQLSFMQAGSYLWQTRRLEISRSSYTGDDGFEISVAADDITALADRLTAHPLVKPIGLAARDSLRQEAGLPLYGQDLTENIDPISAGLAFAISPRRRTDGGFPGADGILAKLAHGTPARRVGIALEGHIDGGEGAAIYADEVEVGRITSTGFSPSLDHAIAMGFVDTALAVPGTALTIELRGNFLRATVVSLPFIPHLYYRLAIAAD